MYLYSLISQFVMINTQLSNAEPQSSLMHLVRFAKTRTWLKTVRNPVDFAQVGHHCHAMKNEIKNRSVDEVEKC